MKRLFLFSAILILLSSFTPTRQCIDQDHILLVLTNTLNQESFSIFSVRETNGILVGSNREDYPVPEGIYRIEGSSSNRLYHRNIIVVKE